MCRPGALRRALSWRSRIGGWFALEGDRSSSEQSTEELEPPSESTSSEGVRDGTGTRWEDCLRERVPIDGVEGMTVTVVEESMSAEMDGTGGGEAGIFSLELKSRMNPLFLYTQTPTSSAIAVGTKRTKTQKKKPCPRTPGHLCAVPWWIERPP